MLWIDFDREWRHEGTLLERTGSGMTRAMIAVGFRLPRGQLAITDAADENGPAFGPPDRRCRRHSLR